MTQTKIGLKDLFIRFKWKIIATNILVLLEGAIFLLFPLLIGKSLDGLLSKDFYWLYVFAGLNIAMLIIGSLRRFYDSRVYAKIFTTVSSEMVLRERAKNSPVSKINARVGLFSELVEFLENSFPSIIFQLIGWIGTLIILFVLNLKIFLGALFVLFVVGVIYYFTTPKTVLFNKNMNDTLESQVAELEKTEKDPKLFFASLMHWNIKLSDLETKNFAGSWLIMAWLLLMSIYWATQTDNPEYGTLLSLVMYVYKYIETTISLPMYYQQTVRLKEISSRLK